MGYRMGRPLGRWFRSRLFGAVSTIWSVISVASWEWSSGLDNNWGPLSEASSRFLLIVVEWLALHDNVLTEVLITVRTSGEELVIWWRAGNSSDSGVNASGDLEETTGGGHSLGPGWLVEVWWGITKLNSRGSSKEKSNNSGLH